LRLPRQSFQILALLLEKPGQLVTREELQGALWPEDTFVDSEKGINAAINRLRNALCDSADKPRYIETLSRRGYRFIGVLESRAPAVVPTPKTRNLRLLLPAGVVLAIVLGLGIWRLSRSRSDAPLPPIEVVPLAGLGSQEIEAAFSPDGNHVAYADHSPSREGIYVTTVGGQNSQRLTSDFHDCCPRWSPDGRQVAFSRITQGAADIFVIPASGGAEHRLSEWPLNGHQITTIPKYRAIMRCFDWSPDGKSVVLTGTQEDKTHSWIALLALADSAARPLTSPQSPEVDYAPAVSPDGTTVAFIRGTAAGVAEDLYVVPTAGGVPRRLTSDNAPIGSPASWTPDSHDLVFSSLRGGTMSLWRISAGGGSPEPVPGVGVGSFLPSVALKGHQLIYQHQADGKLSMWRLDLNSDRQKQNEREIITTPSGRPHFSPDGKRIVFESTRLGYSEIWVCDSEGVDCRQLTYLKGVAGAARWSPDGRYIAFEYRPHEHTEVYLLDLSTGLSRILTTLPGADNGGPSWSRDGKWIYFYSDRGGSFQVWKTPISGGSPEQVTKNGGVFASESVEGQYLYFSKYEVPGVWRASIKGGEETRILDQPAGDDWWNWALTRDGIYFYDPPKMGSKPAIKLLAFATGNVTAVAVEDAPEPSFGLAVSPDSRTILFTHRALGESRIMVMKNFR
jgi:Tol biopolymer transport system component